MEGTGEVLVLCYHGISETWPDDTAVAPAELEGELTHLVSRGYRGATFSEALTAPPHRRTLVATFDDANRSVLELAAPVLERLGLPGTVFVPTDYPGSGQPMAWAGLDHWLGTDHERELECMSWEEIRGLAGRGWEMGSHTCSHPRLATLSDDDLRRELADSKKVLEEQLERPCTSIAYPYSNVDERVMRATRDAGYLFGAGVPKRFDVPLPLRWPRVGVSRGDWEWRFRRRVSPAMRHAFVSPVLRPLMERMRPAQRPAS